MDRLELDTKIQKRNIEGSENLLPLTTNEAARDSEIAAIQLAWLQNNVFCKSDSKWWIDNRDINWLQKATSKLSDLIDAIYDKYQS